MNLADAATKACAWFHAAPENCLFWCTLQHFHNLLPCMQCKVALLLHPHRTTGWFTHKFTVRLPYMQMQCKAPFSYMYLHKQLDGTLSDYPVEEVGVCLIDGAL
jgi:hypothetical protein